MRCAGSGALEQVMLPQSTIAEGVALNPGAEWSTYPNSGHHKLRLCFSSLTKVDIREGIG